MKIVCLVSGGLDSSLLLYMLKKDGNDLFPLFIDYGQKAVRMELKAYSKICKLLKVKPFVIRFHDFARISLSGLTNKNLSPIDAPFVPGRNLLFLVIAASYAYSKGTKIISIGLLKNAVFPDQTKKFITNAENIIQISTGYKIKVLSPFMKLDKRGIIGLVKKHNFPLKITYSCQTGNSKPCGKCASCKERKLAEKHPVI